MEFLSLFKLFSFFTEKSYKSGYRPSLDNYYSNQLGPANRDYPINATHRLFMSLQHGDQKMFKTFLNKLMEDSANIDKVIKATNLTVLISIMDALANHQDSGDAEFLENRIVLYLKILKTDKNSFNPDVVEKQSKFLQPMNDTIVQLLNEIEAQLILDNRIKLIRTINACQRK
ncbi:MAG: hypothetical protein GQ574_29040 [Crocinitomix sp.]|nr:hypothetical protein [Crocinitomix sp.]